MEVDISLEFCKIKFRYVGSLDLLFLLGRESCLIFLKLNEKIMVKLL